MKTLKDLSLKGRTVLVREDLNVPFDDSGILSYARIDAALETLEMLIQKGAKIIVMSHLGRPKGREEKYSLKIVAEALSKRLNRPVPLFGLTDKVPTLQETSIALLENVRFYEGETDNSEMLAKQYAALCDVFMIDAFGASHRAHASTTGVIAYAKEVAVGPLLEKELSMLSRALEHPQKPMVAIVGGGKVSTKLEALLNLVEKVDVLVVGGAIANTFLKSKGVFVGRSLVEEPLLAMAQQILARAKALGKTVWLPKDVVVAPGIESETATIKTLDEISDEDQIFDIGPESCQDLKALLSSAKTIVWNGPMGVFEKRPFAQGTKALAQAVAASTAFSIAGGGETLAAVEQCDVRNEISYLSTGGGAFLEVLEGKILPVVQALQNRENE